jgi:Tol biopolymer transport system component
MEKEGGNLRQLTFTPQLDQNPFVAGDDQFVIFSSERSGVKTLWRMKLDGSEQVPIVERATIENFTVSPDGKTIYYYSYFEDQGALWRVRLDGSNREKMVDGRFESPAVSPDGKQIAAVHKKNESSKSELALWNPDDASSMRFLKLIDGAQLPGAIRWSKDGKSIVYVVNQKGVGNIWRQPLDGGKPEQLTHFPSSRLFYFAFSADEKEVTCARGQVEGYLVLVSLDK